MIIDSAREKVARMTMTSLESVRASARACDVGFLYVSPERNVCELSC